MSGLIKQYRCVALVVLAWLVFLVPGQGAAWCCPFCNMAGQTLTGEVNQASMVLFGSLTNAKQEPQAGAPDGTTDLVIEMVVKNHESLKNNKLITLPRYINLMQDGTKYKFLVFIDIFKNKIDPYRGLAVKADSDMPAYLKGALAVKDQKPEKRLRFFFDYLDNGDMEISNDAYKEFANADYKDYRDMAKNLPADRIAGWLQSDKTPGFRFGLYASMLGHCGTEKHAALLRSMLDDQDKQASSGVDGMLAGYVMLKPKEGWDYLKGILKDPRTKFLHRYAALKATRFFWDLHNDLIAKKDLIEGLLPLLDMKDISDLVIEDFRRWGCWDLTDRVLALQKSPVYNVNVVKRAILRFALTAKDSIPAQEFVAALRKKDPSWVADVEELLKLDQAPVPQTPAVSKTSRSK